MLRILVLCAVAAVGLAADDCCAQKNSNNTVVKVSSTVIRNGSTVYTFYSPNYPKATDIWNGVPIMFRADKSAMGYFAMPPNEPSWAISYSETYPDINYLGENQLRLYFVALKGTARSQTAAIGVAVSDTLGATGNRFIALPEPLIEAYGGEALANPSLYRADDGNLFLYYFNSSASSYGNIVNVPLSRDGLRLNLAPAPNVPSNTGSTKTIARSAFSILTPGKTESAAAQPGKDIFA